MSLKVSEDSSKKIYNARHTAHQHLEVERWVISLVGLIFRRAESLRMLTDLKE